MSPSMVSSVEVAVESATGIAADMAVMDESAVATVVEPMETRIIVNRRVFAFNWSSPRKIVPKFGTMITFPKICTAGLPQVTDFTIEHGTIPFDSGIAPAG